MPETRTFLLEIGTEEIPVSYLELAVSYLADEFKKALESLGFPRKPYGEIIKMWTPRRLVVLIENIPVMTLEKSYLTQGPPAKIAKDADGNWTMAAKKFAEKHGADESALSIQETDNGSYVFVKVLSKQQETKDFLSSTLADLIRKIPFPKRMRWLKYKDITFARPIRWICAIFGSEPIEFEFSPPPWIVNLSNRTYGHRFAYPESITIGSPEEYIQKLKKGFVYVNQDERNERIAAELSKAAEKLGGPLVQDEGLLAEVTNLVEYPKVLACDLGGYTDLPREVLQTALAKHQRAFVVEKKGKLLPHFLVVANSPMLEPKLSKQWFERMAISRLEDAEFFIKEDLRKGLEPLIEEESRVEWIKGIGTLSDKTRWLTELGAEIGKAIPDFNLNVYERAAYLAKADLLTNLVREKEFTSLQGIAGAIYAERSGEKPEVSNAIGQQYTDSPSSNESAILAISDRLLNIAATFIVGKPPKGSSDPFALRRQAAAIMKIIVDRELPLNLSTALDRTIQLIGKGEDKRGAIYTFLVDRLRLFLTDQDFAYDWVDAVLAVAGDEPYDSYLRLSAFRELDKGEEFRLVAVGQKRVANITRGLADTTDPDTSLFGQEEEEALWKESERIRPKLDAALDKRNYRKTLELLLSLRPLIDRFFDEVFVMVEDEKIRANRLNLVAAVRNEFLKVADFSRIVVEG